MKKITRDVKPVAYIDTPETGNLLDHPVLPGCALIVGELVDLEHIHRDFRKDLAKHGVDGLMSLAVLSDIVTDGPRATFVYHDTRRTIRMLVHFRACDALAKGVDKHGAPASYATSDRVAACGAVLGQYLLIDAPSLA